MFIYVCPELAYVLLCTFCFSLDSQYLLSYFTPMCYPCVSLCPAICWESKRSYHSVAPLQTLLCMESWDTGLQVCYFQTSAPWQQSCIPGTSGGSSAWDVLISTCTLGSVMCQGYWNSFCMYLFHISWCCDYPNSLNVLQLYCYPFEHIENLCSFPLCQFFSISCLSILVVSFFPLLFPAFLL